MCAMDPIQRVRLIGAELSGLWPFGRDFPAAEPDWEVGSRQADLPWRVAFSSEQNTMWHVGSGILMSISRLLFTKGCPSESEGQRNQQPRCRLRQTTGLGSREHQSTRRDGLPVFRARRGAQVFAKTLALVQVAQHRFSEEVLSLAVAGPLKLVMTTRHVVDQVLHPE
jgi:hypothetical protein